MGGATKTPTKKRDPPGPDFGPLIPAATSRSSLALASLSSACMQGLPGAERFRSRQVQHAAPRCSACDLTVVVNSTAEEDKRGLVFPELQCPAKVYPASGSPGKDIIGSLTTPSVLLSNKASS